MVTSVKLEAITSSEPLPSTSAITGDATSRLPSLKLAFALRGSIVHLGVGLVYSQACTTPGVAGLLRAPFTVATISSWPSPSISPTAGAELIQPAAFSWRISWPLRISRILIQWPLIFGEKKQPEPTTI